MVNSDEIKKISDGFVNYFKSKGYILHDSEPIIPIHDKTIAFINATIVPLKTFFTKSYNPPGFVVYQPCIRLWNIVNNNFDGSFTSFFRMVSILIHPGIELNKVRSEISEYLEHILNISADSIMVHSSKLTDDLVGDWRKKYKVVQDEFESKFYKWNYGFSDIKGRGVTLFIKFANGCRELGNFVEITKNKKVIGYEFGFGIESCLGIIHGYSSNFDILFGKNINKKLFDITSVRGVIEQALVLHKGKLNGTTLSSIRKVDNELVYAICEFCNGDPSYIRNMNWDLLDVKLEIVENLISFLDKKIKQVRIDIKLFIDYKIYLNRMIKLGRGQDWATKKMESYMQKNNYYKVVDLFNKNIIL